MRKTKEKRTYADVLTHMISTICTSSDICNCCDGRCTLRKEHMNCTKTACKEYKMDDYFKEICEFLDELTD